MDGRWKPGPFWKTVALRELNNLKQRASELTKKEKILFIIENLDLPPELKVELLREPISLGIILPPMPMGWAVNTTEQTIDRMIEKIRNFKEGK